MEYLIALQRAELDWLRATVADIREGRMSWDPSANLLHHFGGEGNA